MPGRVGEGETPRFQLLVRRAVGGEQGGQERGRKRTSSPEQKKRTVPAEVSGKAAITTRGKRGKRAAEEASKKHEYW